MRIDEEIVLSDGEALSLASVERLAEIQRNSHKLKHRLGRTSHYKRKNRATIDRLEEDMRLVERELQRRRALTTVSFCGLTFHLKEVYVRGAYDGGKERVYELARLGPSPYSSICRDQEQTITIRGSDLKEYISRGAIKHVAEDPCAPWQIADIED